MSASPSASPPAVFMSVALSETDIRLFSFDSGLRFLSTLAEGAPYKPYSNYSPLRSSTYKVQILRQSELDQADIDRLLGIDETEGTTT